MGINLFLQQSSLIQLQSKIIEWKQCTISYTNQFENQAPNVTVFVTKKDSYFDIYQDLERWFYKIEK